MERPVTPEWFALSSECLAMASRQRRRLIKPAQKYFAGHWSNLGTGPIWQIPLAKVQQEWNTNPNPPMPSLTSFSGWSGARPKGARLKTSGPMIDRELPMRFARLLKGSNEAKV